LKVLTTLASVAAIRVENARLTEEQMERGTARARAAGRQRNSTRFLPAAAPQIEVMNYRASAFPAMKSADYYDFIQREDGKMVVALATFPVKVPLRHC